MPAGIGGTATCGSETLRTESHAGRLAGGHLVDGEEGVGVVVLVHDAQRLQSFRVAGVVDRQEVGRDDGHRLRSRHRIDVRDVDRRRVGILLQEGIAGAAGELAVTFGQAGNVSLVKFSAAYSRYVSLIATEFVSAVLFWLRVLISG